MTEVGYCYCGGCNPRYDRVTFVKRLAEICPRVSLKFCGTDESCGALLLICGCSTACLKPKPGVVFFRVTDESDFLATVDFLCRQAGSDHLI